MHISTLEPFLSSTLTVDSGTVAKVDTIRMKQTTRALPLAVLAATAWAQTNTVVGNDPELEGTTTITYSVCPTDVTTTTTLSSTLTLCPGPYCNGGSPTVTLGPGQGGETVVGYTTVGPNGESTVYETVYPQTCSTGMADVTYMITEACPCEATRASDYVPSGFSTTVATVLTKTCDTCEESETTITLTTPCSTGAYATAGVTNTGGASAATGAEAGSSGGAAATGAAASGPGVTGAGATGAAAPTASGAVEGNSGSGSGSPGVNGSSAAAGGAPAVSNSNSNSTINPPITPVGGNVASDVGSNPATFTGAAHKIDLVGVTATAAFVFIGAAAWWL